MSCQVTGHRGMLPASVGMLGLAVVVAQLLGVGHGQPPTTAQGEAAKITATNWPQWRGPLGTGVSPARNVPVFWNEQQNLIWKAPLPPWGTSTPVIWGDAIFVTAHSAADELLLLRIDKKTGREVWRRAVGKATAPRKAAPRSTQKFHPLHNLASPSPVTDGNTVVAHFGNGELAAFDFAGRLVWRRNLQTDYGDYSIWWGHANSPILHDGLVISVCMQDSLADKQPAAAPSYLVAHQLRDGIERWKVNRDTGASAEQGDSYTTPLLTRVGGTNQLVVMGGNQLDAYDPRTGRRLWYLPGLVGGRTVTGPTVGRDMVFATQGMKRALVAVRLGKTGKLTRRGIAWKYTQGTPDSCSPVLWDTWLFTVTDDGIVRCFDALTGHLKFKKRVKGNYKASPVAVEGRVFLLNTDGLCTVISAAPRFDKLTENQLDDQTLASIAVSDNRIYIRGRNALYCLGR